MRGEEEEMEGEVEAEEKERGERGGEWPEARQERQAEDLHQATSGRVGPVCLGRVYESCEASHLARWGSTSVPHNPRRLAAGRHPPPALELCVRQRM